MEQIKTRASQLVCVTDKMRLCLGLPSLLTLKDSDRSAPGSEILCRQIYACASETMHNWPDHIMSVQILKFVFACLDLLILIYMQHELVIRVHRDIC